MNILMICVHTDPSHATFRGAQRDKDAERTHTIIAIPNEYSPPIACLTIRKERGRFATEKTKQKAESEERNGTSLCWNRHMQVHN
jgi:hypothetical protein